MRKMKLLFVAALLIAGISGCDEAVDVMYLDTDTNPTEKTCANVCEAGSECMDETTYRTCKDTNGDGCTEWTDHQSCEAGTVCQDGTCVDPQGSCTNACDEIDAKRCHENTQETCGDYNEDGCLEWGNPTTCGAGTVCQDGTCVDPQGSCTNACDEINAKRCHENTQETCGDYNEDGCLEWGNATPCENGKVCQDGACIDPPPTCTDQCPQMDVTQCKEDTTETCGDYDSDGCLEWGNPQKCKYGCSDNTCNSFPECPSDAKICPKPITKFNEWIDGDTSKSVDVIKKYPSCHDVGSTETQNEGGPEDYYMVNLTEPGVLIINVNPAKKVDVDVHLLSELNGDQCIARGDVSTGSHLDTGIYYISVDTYSGSSNAGAYQLRVFFIPDSSKCGMVQKVMQRRNDDKPLPMPVVGRVGRESHLVTTYDQEQHGGSSWWPSDAWDSKSLKIHKDHTIKMYGEEIISYGNHEGDNKWCGCNSKGQCGHASYGKALPPDAEAWDVNMNWKKETKPAPGTRYLALNPKNGKAVVAAAGYETGPGRQVSMGGAVPEIHNYFGTSDGHAMLFGELKNQDFAYGPIDCFSDEP